MKYLTSGPLNFHDFWLVQTSSPLCQQPITFENKHVIKGGKFESQEEAILTSKMVGVRKELYSFEFWLNM